MIRSIVVDNAWPGTAPIPLLAQTKPYWVTLRRSPSSFLELHQHGRALRLYLGLPMLVTDPAAYVVPMAFSTDTVTPTGAGVSLTVVDRKLELLCSDAPVWGGWGRLSFTVSKPKTVATTLCRMATEGVERVTVNVLAGSLTPDGEAIYVDGLYHEAASGWDDPHVAQTLTAPLAGMSPLRAVLTWGHGRSGDVDLPMMPEEQQIRLPNHATGSHFFRIDVDMVPR